jgi:hypothetical protein
MRKQLVFLVLILICASSAVAGMHRYDLRQFYSGEARPRSEVVWIWLDFDVHIGELDGVAVTAPPPKPQNPCFGNFHIAELLPGKHEIWVSYSDSMGVQSTSYQSLSIDAKAGENYQIKPNYKAKWVGKGQWNPTIEPFTPDAKNAGKATECRL